MPFIYQRTIFFRDTDAAGVVYFANVLAMCHEAYEASLAASGIEIKPFFSHPNIAIPITHASVDFFQPMFCGDRCQIQLKPELTSNHQFEIHYEIYPDSRTDKLIGKALTKHVAIDAVKRARVDLPSDLMQWLRQWAADTSPDSL
ncbi:acyl-CoA thioesterase [Oculatella sp. LEGE 06141]|uniref:acyl-CoA thioesterase n=1 Tax=Oculatella sp. LEGE 06141 TaxID=1828648 RepID=UPI0018826F9A|nr:thioesterase family protein [Oculatella sp. LEGE 06141]MBE9177183.1 acyl-CoA thioesterase [Oculatella sp. LEGE 06141]